VGAAPQTPTARNRYTTKERGVDERAMDRRKSEE
jgi:hypothetical protein